MYDRMVAGSIVELVTLVGVDGIVISGNKNDMHRL